MLDLQSWLLLLETARALSGPSQSMAGQTTIREILCLPETVTGRAFDLELRLDDLDLTPRVSLLCCLRRGITCATLSCAT